MISSQTHEWVLEHRGGSDPDEAFTLRFSQSCPTEKWKLVLGFATDEELNRRRAEMNRLCGLVLCSDPMIWKEESSLYWGLLASHSPHPARFWLRSLTSSKKLSSAYLKKWAVALERFGPLRPRVHYLCAREFIKENPRLASGEMAAPSYHERLEARLELKSWARQHLPQDVWAEIEDLDLQI